MVLLCDSQVLRARNRGESCGISPVVVGHPNYVSNLGLFGGVFQSFPIHILSYFEYINMIKYGSIEYIIQFISICLSYFDVSHFEIWTESEYIYIYYIHIYMYLKTLKKWYVFQFLMGEGQGTFESQKPFPSPTFLRRLNCWMALTMSGAETCKQPHIILFSATTTKDYDFSMQSQRQRSRYTAVYSWPFGCSSHWASSIYR